MNESIEPTDLAGKDKEVLKALPYSERDITSTIFPQVACSTCNSKEGIANPASNSLRKISYVQTASYYNR